MTDAKHAPHDPEGRRLTVRRSAALGAALGAASCLVFLLGADFLWPLFVFPLFLGAVFFFEPGSLAVTFWLGNYFVLYYSFRAPATAGVTRQALLGMVLFFVAGLMLGRVLRKNHEMQARLAASSLADRLTGLYNYGTFVAFLHNEVTRIDRYGGELTLIMLDLDHFKQFNDRHGHEPGNDVLRRVGATLRGAVRDADMAARYGGEEFAVLIRGDETHGYELAERLRRAIATTAVEGRDGSEVFCTISAGVAGYPVGAAAENELVERADDALCESKRRGRNRVTISTGVSAQNALAASLSA